MARRLLLGILLYVVNGFTAPAAHAVLITVSYEEFGPKSFKWVFDWNRTRPSVVEALTAGTLWNQSVTVTPQGANEAQLSVRSFHVTGPHQGPLGFDQDPGQAFEFTLAGAIVSSEAFTGGATELSRLTTLHPHNPLPNHGDSYLLTAFTPVPREPKTTFTLTGIHTPEPGTLLLFGMGLLGLGVRRRVVRENQL